MSSVAVSHLTVMEHEAISVSQLGSATTLSAAEAELLALLGEKRRGFCQRGYRSVALRQYCGVVNLGVRVLEVLPKVRDGHDPAMGRSVLLRLLEASPLRSGFEVLPAGQRLHRSRLLEMFIAEFIDSVAGIIRGGLLRQYQERREDLSVVRGGIDFGRQLGVHFNRPDVIASRYDDLSVDNVWNRLVKAALRTVRPWITSGDLYRRWIEVVAAFDEVVDVQPTSADLDRLVVHRQAVRYAKAMGWVRWVLQLLSPAFRAGDELAPSYLFDMNRLFEDAVRNLLAGRLRSITPALELAPRGAARHLARIAGEEHRKAFALLPDIVLREGGEIRLIAETKWKRVKVGPKGDLLPDRGDMYQMHAYAAAYGVDRLALIYPMHSGMQGAKATEFVLRGAGGARTRLAVACVDVTNDGLPVAIGPEALIPQKILS